MEYSPSQNRYSSGMKYTPCGESGLLLPKIALGLWHNFGHSDNFQTSKDILEFAFDQGITYFDLANNYGIPAGSAEENFGKIFHQSFQKHREEILIATKAGHKMWEGPYGDGSSRKNLVSSLDQSLKRMRLDYVDIFYSHRYDGTTPIEETMQTLIDLVHSGKALYVGISKYPPELAEKCYTYLESKGVHCLICQDRYSMLTRNVENGTLQTAFNHRVGFCAFSPLAQGLLSDKYLKGIPSDSRAAQNGFLKKDQITPERLSIIQELQELAQGIGMNLAEMSICWLLSNPMVTTVLVGASSTSQLENNLKASRTPTLKPELNSSIHNILSRYK
jgi:L-glyceraldehyde 3-phosphate reductase